MIACGKVLNKLNYESSTLLCAHFIAYKFTSKRLNIESYILKVLVFFPLFFLLPDYVLQQGIPSSPHGGVAFSFASSSSAAKKFEESFSTFNSSFLHL